jgi:nucleoside-diphosphate-sugar epimerase
LRNSDPSPGGRPTSSTTRRFATIAIIADNALEMTLHFVKVAILGATGATGKFLAREWSTRGVAVRVVSRSSEHLERAFPEPHIEKLPADVLDAEATRRAVDGCDLVFDCIGLPLPRINDHSVAARNIAAAAGSTSFRIVQVSSYWPYIPIVSIPVNETHPRVDGPLPARARREAEDILLEAGACVLNLPDFYGPDASISILNRALTEAAGGKTVNWIGSRDTGREHIYVPDAMRTAARLAVEEKAYGERWVVPGAGPITLDRLVEIAGAHLGRAISTRTAGPVMLSLLGLISSDLRALKPLVPTYTSPITFDGAKLRSVLGEYPSTPYEEGIGATLDWIG